MLRLVRVVTCLSVLLTACADGADAPSRTAPPSSPAAPTARGTPLTQEEAEKPQIEITYPEPGADPVAPAGVIVAVTVRSFAVVDKMGEPAKEGEGHIHYYIDVDDLPTDPGEPAVTDDDRAYHPAAQTSYTWENVKPGMHTFAVQLVNNDHTPLEPAVTDEVTVRVGD